MQDRCRKWKETALSSGILHLLLTHLDKRVAALITALHNTGFPIPTSQIQCLLCTEPAHGAYIPATRKILLCANNISSYTHLTDVLTHELTHAFDHTGPGCNGVGHNACSEIRAINLAGDCSMINEFLRGRFRVRGMYEVSVCV
jgi:inner membrane protease ATP23